MKMFDAGKTRVIGLPYGEKNCDNMLRRFHLIPERNGQINGKTDGQTDLLYQYRASKINANMQLTIISFRPLSLTRFFP